MSKYGWSADESGQIFICSQEESIKPKNIVEKIDFDSEWPGETWYPPQNRLLAQGEPVKGLAGCSHPLHKAACARLVLLLCASVSRRKASDSTSYDRACGSLCVSHLALP